MIRLKRIAASVAAGVLLSSASPAVALAEEPYFGIQLATPDDTIQTQLVSDGTAFAQHVNVESPDLALVLPIDFETIDTSEIADGTAISIEFLDIVGPGPLEISGPEYLWPGESDEVTLTASEPGFYLGTLRLAAYTDDGHEYYSDLSFVLALGEIEDDSDPGFDWHAWATENPVQMAADINSWNTEFAKFDRDFMALRAQLEEFYAEPTDTQRSTTSQNRGQTGTQSTPTNATQAPQPSGQQATTGQTQGDTPAVLTVPASADGGSGHAAPAASGGGTGGGTSAPGGSGGLAPASAGAPVAAPAAAPAAAAPAAAPAATSAPAVAPEDVVVEETNDTEETLPPPAWLFPEEGDSADNGSETLAQGEAPTAEGDNSELWQGVALGAGVTALAVGLLKLAMSIGELRGARRATGQL